MRVYWPLCDEDGGVEEENGKTGREKGEKTEVID